MLRRVTALALVIAATVAISSPAQAHLVRPFKGNNKQHLAAAKENLAHVEYVCARGAGKVKRNHCEAIPWLKDVVDRYTVHMFGRWAVDSCTAQLIDRETGGTWSVYTTNPTSGAYGLPQALPGSKMASAGPDWRTNPWTQVRWMIGYMNSVYGGSCNALAHSFAYGWY